MVGVCSTFLATRLPKNLDDDGLEHDPSAATPHRSQHRSRSPSSSPLFLRVVRRWMTGQRKAAPLFAPRRPQTRLDRTLCLLSQGLQTLPPLSVLSALTTHPLVLSPTPHVVQRERPSLRTTRIAGTNRVRRQRRAQGKAGEEMSQTAHRAQHG